MTDVGGIVPTVPAQGAGCLYLHVPFCESLCPFCSFHRVQHSRPQGREYFAYLRQEVLRYYEAGYRFSSAYFGGGTPTTEPEELVKTLEFVRQLFEMRDISVETNPSDLRPEILIPLRKAGLTRLSVGVQSFDDGLLRDMERLERYGCGAATEENVKHAARMFPTLNVDLIFNLPHQTAEGFKRDLEIVLRTGANQVSCYPLMISPAVKERMKASVGLPDRKRLRTFYRTIHETLYPEFRPSSAWCFSRQGNTSDEYIVEADYYVGVGSGAFSYVEGTLYATTFSLKEYEKRISQGLTGITVQHRLTRNDQMRYALLVKMFGLDLKRSWVEKHFGKKFFWRMWGELRTLEWLGAATRNETGWHLTERGMYWLMLMMSAFFESVGRYREAVRAHLPCGKGTVI